MHRMRIKWIVDNIEAGSKLLDIGCSAGEFITYIQTVVPCRVTGIDVNSGAIAVAQEHGIDAKVAQAEALPFADKTFDVCLLSEILEHLYNPLDCLSEARRVLKDNGMIIGSVPHRDSFILKNKPFDVYKFHARDYSPKLLREHLLKYFSKVVIKTVMVHLLEQGQSPFWLVFKGEK